jgi:hypothetical protein
VRTQERTVNKSKQQPQTGTFSLDEVMEAVREDRQKDIDAGREYYPMNEARTRAAAENTEAVTKITIINDNDSRSPTEEASPMEYSELLQAGIDEGILSEAPAVEVDLAERKSAAGHIEASFTPPNGTFKEVLRANDNLKEIIDAARKALDDAFESDRTCSQIEDHLSDAKEARAKWQRYAGAKLFVVKRRVKEDGGHWGDFVSEHFPFYSIRTVQWHIKRFLDEEGDEDTLDDLNPPKPQSVAEDYGREDWVMTDDGEAEADPMILEDTLEDRPVVAPVVLPGIAEAPEAAPANKAADDRNANDDCVTPTQSEPKPADSTAAQRQQRHRDKLAEKRVANGGKPSRTRKSTERAALERDLVALMGDMDDETLRGVLGFASRAVKAKTAKAAA